MTIFEFAMLRAARQRMTPAELDTAQKLADRADAGEPGYANLLRKMVRDILFDRNRVDSVEPLPSMTARVLE